MQTVITIIHSDIVFFPSQLPCVCMTWVKNIPNSLFSFLLPLTISPQRFSKCLKLRATSKVPFVYKSLPSDTPPHRHKGDEEANNNISIHLLRMRDVWEWSWISNPSLSPIPLPPCCKIKAVMSENGHFLCPSLCSEIFPPSHLLDKQSKPRNTFQMRRNSNFYFSFSHPSATSFLSSQKAQSSFSWEAASISDYLDLCCLQEAVLALSTPEHRRRDPSRAPCSSGGESCCPDAALPRKGLVCLSGLFDSNTKVMQLQMTDTRKEVSIRYRTKAGLTPCKQHWGQAAKMCPLQPEHRWHHGLTEQGRSLTQFHWTISTLLLLPIDIP